MKPLPPLTGRPRPSATDKVDITLDLAGQFEPCPHMSLAEADEIRRQWGPDANIEVLSQAASTDDPWW